MGTYIGEQVKVKAKVFYYSNPPVEKEVIHFNFKCAHENVQVKAGEVICTDCNSTEITEEEAVSILESYLDAQEAREIDEGQQE